MIDILHMKIKLENKLAKINKTWEDLLLNTIGIRYKNHRNKWYIFKTAKKS